MKTKFNYNGLEFTMSARNAGTVAKVWDHVATRFKYVVSITTPAGCTRFNFYDSVYNYEKGVNELDRRGLLNALDCFLSDASLYDCACDFDDFCAELGYNEMKDYKRALNAFQGCKRHHVAAVRVFGPEYYNILDEINA